MVDGADIHRHNYRGAVRLIELWLTCVQAPKKSVDQQEDDRRLEAIKGQSLARRPLALGIAGLKIRF
jgi:hypothetical protein